MFSYIFVFGAAVYFYYIFFQCCGSTSFWCQSWPGSGSDFPLWCRSRSGSWSGSYPKFYTYRKIMIFFPRQCQFPLIGVIIFNILNNTYGILKFPEKVIIYLQIWCNGYGRAKTMPFRLDPDPQHCFFHFLSHRMRPKNYINMWKRDSRCTSRKKLPGAVNTVRNPNYRIWDT